jgi:L-alanine-DL-glutamate epimerase-like enolase superfamily enzyme
MKIKSITAWRQNLALSRPYTIAYQHISVVENAFVVVELENGIRGIGAGCPMEQVTGESMDQTLAALQSDILQVLCGSPIAGFQRYIKWYRELFYRQPAAMAAIDIALHDAFCQSLDISLYDFLGGRTGKMLTSVTIGIANLESTLADAKEFIDKGFKILKVKLGLDLGEDLERLHKLREFCGPHIGIRVDPNQGYSPEELKVFFAKTENLKLELVEQPVLVVQMDALRQLPTEQKSRIAADESLLDLHSAHQLLSGEAACGIFNIKMMKCGGILAAQELANVALAAKTDLMWGCNDESIVSISAALALALAQPNTRYLDLDGSFDLAEDVVKGGFILEDGYLRCAQMPGLGVQF